MAATCRCARPLNPAAGMPLWALSSYQPDLQRRTPAARSSCLSSLRQRQAAASERRQQAPRSQPRTLLGRRALQTAASMDTNGSASGWEGDQPVLSDEEALSSFDEETGSRQQGGAAAAPAAAQQQQVKGIDGGSMQQRGKWRVPIPPHLHGKAPRKHWNANALAFLGDSVWELYARRRFFYPPSAKDSYFSQVVHHVRAETQERLYRDLLESSFLTDAERDVLRWGRNATGVTPKRLSDTGLKRETYRAATAIECLCGYLYLSDQERLHEMMGLLGLGDEPEGKAAAARGRPRQAAAGNGGAVDGNSSSSGEPVASTE